MAYQNINQYNYRRLGLIPFNQVTDFCLASDEKDYHEEVIFSPNHINITVPPTRLTTVVQRKIFESEINALFSEFDNA